MKKLISLLLVIITLSSLLSGCEWNGGFDWKKIFNWGESEPKWELPEGIIETTVEKDGVSFTIAHSENFTQDDIEFVVELHEVQNNASPMLSIMSYNLGTILSNAQEGDPLFLMHFENPYIISAYFKPNLPNPTPDENGDIHFDATRYVWCKFYDPKSMPQKIGDAKLTDNSYLLYDCTVVRDIANGIEYNRECKYYLKYINESSYNRTTTDMIMWYGRSNRITSGRKFIKENGVERTRYEVYTDDNGVKYLVIEGEIYYSNTDKTVYAAYQDLDDYYDILYAHFTRNESLDKVVNRSNGKDYYEIRMVQINLDLLVELLFDK